MHQRCRHLAPAQWGPRRSPGRQPLHPTERVPWRRWCQASLWATLAAMPFNESRQDLSPECDEAESSSVRETRVPVVLLWTGHRIDLDSDRRGRRTECETRRSAQIGLSSTPFCPPLRWRENPGRDCAATQRALSHAANASRASSGCCRPTPIRNRSVGPSVSSERNKLAGSRMTPASARDPWLLGTLGC